MIFADELDDENGFICPLCGFPLSLLRRINKNNNELSILVTCECCEEYHGFVILTDLIDDDLELFNNPIKKKYKATIVGYNWNKEDEKEDDIDFDVRDFVLEDVIGPIQPSLDINSNREDWIDYLSQIKLVPIWSNKYNPSIYFKRIVKDKNGVDYAYGFDKKTRLRVAEILGIKTEDDCKKVREEIKRKFDSEIP